jgi:hypothetical protein
VIERDLGMIRIHQKCVRLLVGTVLAAISLGRLAGAQVDDEAEQELAKINRIPTLDDVVLFQNQRNEDLKKQLEKRIVVTAGSPVGLQDHFETIGGPIDGPASDPGLKADPTRLAR